MSAVGLEIALAHVRAWAADQETLLRALVDINSYSANRAGCDATADRLAKALELRALTLVRERGIDHGDHLVFETDAARGGGHVLCIGHHDTVFPPGTFEGYRREGDLALGPGTLDMKGGLVVVVAALRALDEVGMLGRVPVRFITVADEEVGSPESAGLVRVAARGGRAALGFESGRANDAIITARKGTASVRVVAHGRAAHAGNAHAEGHNAIWPLCRFVDRAQGLTDYTRGLTVNTGLIQGGEAKNTVPALAEATIDLRFIRSGDGEMLVRELTDLAGDAMDGVVGTRLEVTRRSWRPPLERTASSAALAAEYGRIQQQCGLGGGESPLQGGGSDAANAAAEGVPSIDGLGPRGTGFHTRGERIEVPTLVTKSLALVTYLWGVARG